MTINSPFKQLYSDSVTQSDSGGQGGATVRFLDGKGGTDTIKLNSNALHDFVSDDAQTISYDEQTGEWTITSLDTGGSSQTVELRNGFRSVSFSDEATLTAGISSKGVVSPGVGRTALADAGADTGFYHVDVAATDYNW
uniref:hypothetical protein n=1 Tax=Phaeobacter sp. TaxID=1902409 RepID=UPI0025E91E00